MHITFLGLGTMGAALVRAHLKAGSTCTIWNRTISKPIVSELQKEGALVQGDLLKAIVASQYLVICLVSHETAFESLDGLPDSDQATEAFSKLKAVINLTSGTPGDAKKMNEWMKERQASVYIAGAIMAGPDNIGNPESSFILYSGDIPETIEEEVKDLISVFGRAEYAGAKVKSARIYDNASLAATYSLFAGVMLSTAILSKAKSEDQSSTVEHQEGIFKPFQSYVSPLLRAAVNEIDDVAKSVEDDNEDAQGSAVSMLGASMRNVVRTCEEMGVDAGIIEQILSLCDEVVNDGQGGNGLTIVAKRMMRKNG